MKAVAAPHGVLVWVLSRRSVAFQSQYQSETRSVVLDVFLSLPTPTRFRSGRTYQRGVCRRSATVVLLFDCAEQPRLLNRFQDTFYVCVCECFTFETSVWARFGGACINAQFSHAAVVKQHGLVSAVPRFPLNQRFVVCSLLICRRFAGAKTSITSTSVMFSSRHLWVVLMLPIRLGR